MTDANPDAILKALEMTIKSVGKDIRRNHGGADKINRMAALVNSYSRLAALCVEEEEPFNLHEAQMRRE